MRTNMEVMFEGGLNAVEPTRGADGSQSRGLQIIVTLLRADLAGTQARQIGSPLPNAGEGFGGEGDSTEMNQLPETIAG